MNYVSDSKADSPETKERKKVRSLSKYKYTHFLINSKLRVFLVLVLDTKAQSTAY